MSQSEKSPTEQAEAEIEAEIVPEEKKEEEFPWAQDDDERRRSFIFVQMTDCASANMGFHEIKAEIGVQHMDMIDKWLKDGTVPTEKTAKPLRVMSSTKTQNDI